MDKKEIGKIARLARLKLTEDEKNKIPGQLLDIIEYIDQLSDLDTEDVPPIGQPFMDKLRLAEDRAVRFEDIEKLYENAPDFKDGYFRVKKILE